MVGTGVGKSLFMCHCASANFSIPTMTISGGGTIVGG
jgi:hypothetical protein